MTANLALLLAVVAFVVNNPSKGQASRQNSIVSSEGTLADNPLDQLSSADIAVHVANIVRLEERPSVARNAESVSAQLTITAADDKVVAKPQVVATALKSKKDIQIYTTKAGDTVSSLASRFGVSSDSIRWSNGLTGDVVAAGKQLVLPPQGVNGIVYTVKSGDSPEKLAVTYRATKESIVAFNDAEVTGLKQGERIVIPDGVQPTTRAASGQSAVFSSGSFAWGGYAPVYGSNGYDYGYCTWWAAVRRSQVGKPIPSNLGNASTWKVLAQRAGLPVGNTPAQYAVIWTPPRDYYGHVGFVEEVYADGSVRISEMNVVGWGRKSEKTLTAAQAAGYSYIY